MRDPYRLSWPDRLKLLIIVPLVKLLLWVLLRSCRIVRVDGEQHVVDLIQQNKACLPCCWHQGIFVVIPYLRRLQGKGLKLGFLISPSFDGEIAARVAGGWGMRIVRGSASRTGAQALRDMHGLIKRDGISPMTPPDGPRGPAFEFKTGTVLLSQMTGAPVLPIAYAIDRCWQFSSWDRQMLPKPFARVAIHVGAPVTVDRKLSVDALEETRRAMEQSLNSATEAARAALAQP
jgi:lysophospholipid acyltransferase (LPLAT)-like uncharacterized protein